MKMHYIVGGIISGKYGIKPSETSFISIVLSIKILLENAYSNRINRKKPYQKYFLI